MSIAFRLSLAGLILLSIARDCNSDTRTELGAYYEIVSIQCEVKDNHFREKVVERLVILSKRGDSHRWLGITKSPFARIHGLVATVYDDRGRKVYTRKRGDFLKLKGYGAAFELYNDLGIYETECAAPSYPYTIELEYEREYKSLFFWRGTRVQRMVPIDSFTFELKIKSDIPFGIRQPTGWDPINPIADGDWLIYLWRKNDLTAFDTDCYVPGLLEPDELRFVASRFELGEYEFTDLSWKGIGEWYDRLATDRYLEGNLPITSATDNGGRSKIATLQAIYDSVVDGNRYVAVSMGISGWQPASAEKTIECGYGDCKGLSTLLISRARQHGITCYPALVLTRDRGRIDPDFPEFGFNHLIAVALIDSDSIWMDPTCDVCVFGDLPRMDEAISVLVVTDSGGVIVKTPASEAKDNRTFCRTVLTPAASGNMLIESELEFHGNRAHRLRQIIPRLDAGEIQSFFESMLSGGLSVKVVDYTVENLATRGEPLRIELVCSSEQRQLEVGDCKYTAIPFGRDLFGHLSSRMNHRPAIDTQYPQYIVDSVFFVCTLDPGTEFLELPTSDSAICSLAFSRLTSSQSNDTGLIVLERQVSDYLLPAITYDEFREFYEAARKHVSAAIAQCNSTSN